MQTTTDEPPFRPGDWIQGRPKPQESKVLKGQFSANRIVLGRKVKTRSGARICAVQNAFTVDSVNT